MVSDDMFSPSPSPTLTTSVTLPAISPEPPLTELFTDHFDSGALYLWTLGAGWGLVPSEGGQALSVTNSDAPVTFVHNSLSDVAVQARFLFEAGKARLSLRQSEAGSYAAELSATGLVELHRGTQLIGVRIAA